MIDKKKIVITGVKGTIGQILQKGLEDYQITGLDLPDKDVSRYETFSNLSPDHSTIIHLAWDNRVGNFLNEKVSENSKIIFNVYKAALAKGIKRVIVASSVHADRFDDWKDQGYMSPYSLPNPDSPYGALKVFMESLGRWFSSQGLEVVCVRFGGISLANKANHDYLAERAVFLSQGDGVSLIKSILETKVIPNNFAIVYGVSNNTNRIHDISNPFGWVPKDNAENFLR